MTALMTLAIAIWAQDAKPEPKEEPAKPEARAALVKAFEATAKLGGYEFKGDVSDPAQDNTGAAGIVMNFGGESYLGDFTGAVGKDGTIRLSAKNDKASAAIYRRNGKTVKRLTWSGPALSLDEFADEAAALTSVAHLARAVGELKDKDCRPGADLKIEGVECQCVKAKFPPRLVPRPAGESESNFEMMELQKVEASFYLSKVDARLMKAKVALTYGLSESVRVEMGGQGDDDDMKKEREYEIKFVKYDAALNVDVPEDVKALLGD